MSQTIEVEPTPEFNEVVVNVLRRWTTGELPFKEALALIAASLQEADVAGHVANQGRAEQALGYLQHYRGDLNASIRHYERARTLFQRTGNTRRVAALDLNNGENYRLKGDFTRACRLYRAAHETARQLDNIRMQAIAGVNEGLALLTVGEMGTALKLLQEAQELIDRWTDDLNTRDRLLCELYYGLTMIYLQHGEMDSAWDAARQALHYTLQQPEKIQLGLAYRNMGEVITRLSTPPGPDYASDPDEYFRLALEIFRELNMEAEVARTVFAQARSLAYRGRKTTAARKLQQVMIMFTELGMIDDAAKAAEAQLMVL